jgi:hypothetical protein
MPLMVEKADILAVKDSPTYAAQLRRFLASANGAARFPQAQSSSRGSSML